ncbi:RNA-directed DNA polymerase, eukaryota [Tanacetum coccineum]
MGYDPGTTRTGCSASISSKQTEHSVPGPSSCPVVLGSLSSSAGERPVSAVCLAETGLWSSTLLHTSSFSPTVLVASTTPHDTANTVSTSGFDVCRNYQRDSCSYGARCPTPNTQLTTPAATASGNAPTTNTHHMVTRAKAVISKPLARMNCHVTTTLPIPRSHLHALGDLNWHKAMIDEYNALISNGTWALVPRPANVNVVRSMWLFRHKYNADGSLSRHSDNMALKQAPRAMVFSGLLVYYMGSGFQHSKTDTSLFVYHQGSDIAYLLLYVDDIVLTTSSTALLQCIITLLHSEFAMTDLGSLNYILRHVTLSRSSAEAEYRDVANVVAETAWIRNLLLELPVFLLFLATLVYQDNVSAVHANGRVGINGCLSSSMGSVLVNGSPTTEFKFYKGLKQGDPLSQFLFILVMESLHLAFTNVLNAGIFKGVTLNELLTLSHFFFVDDAVFVVKWEVSNISAIVNVLNIFHMASGLKINIHKSKLMGVGVSKEEVDFAARYVGCSTFTPPFNYLGITLGNNMAKISSWDDHINKLSTRLSKWKSKLLSIGGRFTLIKSVLSSIPLYHMSIFKVLMGVLNNTKAIRRNFLNGVEKADRKICWIGWKKVLAAKKNGGVFALEIVKDVTVAGKFSDSSFTSSLRRYPRGGVEKSQFDILCNNLADVTLPQSRD